MILLLSLFGCPFVSASKYVEVTDVDGDGLDAIRFGGRDCDDLDESVGDCDRDQDGYPSLATGGDDCDDGARDINPGQVERCDGVDNDCDRRIDDADDAVEGTRTWYRDLDGDGYGGTESVQACDAPASYVSLDGDCNDAVPSIFPAAVETCDGVDRNCDGSTDDGATREWYADVDGDGFGDPAALVSTACTPPAEPAVENGNDCDDTNALAHPTGVDLADPTEVCDGIDNDCDGRFDDEDPGLADPDALLLYEDADGDGFGDGLSPRTTCGPTAGFVANDLDCDDTDPSARPGPGPAFSSAEVCDGFDNDCDGLVDAADPGVDASTAFSAFPDLDGDGYGDPFALAQVQCTLGVGFASNDLDCDDGVAEVHPGAPELCHNDRDDDCDALVDSFDPDNDGTEVWYQDLDQDGFGELAVTHAVCAGDVLPGHTPVPGDCNDQDPTIDDVVPWYIDGDGDGFGLAPAPDVEGSEPIDSCFPLLGRSRVAGDCDDLQVNTNPHGIEICDGADNDCSGLADDGAPGSQFGYEDLDGDGFGFGELGFHCTAVALNDLDCDDGDDAIRPGVAEACFEDRDCDGLIGDDDPDVDRTHWYRDADLDGFGDPATVEQRCTQPPGFVRVADDCDDTDASRYFSEYFLRPGPGFRNGQPDLQSIVIHSGRCVDEEEPPTRVTMVDDYRHQGALDLLEHDPGLDVDGQGNTICWDASSVLTTRTTLVLRDLELLPGIGIGTGSCVDNPWAVTPLALASGGDLWLDAVRLADTVLPGSFIQQVDQADPDESVRLRITDSTFDAVTFGDVHTGAAFFETVLAYHDVLVDRTSFTEVVGSGALFHLTGSPLGDSRIELTETTVVGGGFGGPLLHVEGGTAVVLENDIWTDFSVVGGLICLDGVDCTDTALSPFFVDGSGPTNTITSTRNEFRRIEDAAGLDATLFWVPDGTDVESLHNHYQGQGGLGGPLIQMVGATPDDGDGWTSTRDRFIDVRGGFTATTGVHAFEECQFIGLDGFGFEVEQGVLDVHRSTFVDSDVVLDAETLRTSSNIYAESNWSRVDGEGGAAVGTAYVVDGTPWAADCSTFHCDDLDPSQTALVSYHPNLPPERWILYPELNQLPDSFTYTGVPWFLDPNQDNLPVAWQAFHAGTPECRFAGTALFDAVADVDGDGATNEEEALAGSWPCIPDTDGDGVLDGADTAPLDAAAP